MSILIKGMEMPKNCHNCELLTRIEVTYGTVYACQILNEVIRNVMVRQINCPLVELPPHGRLIDVKSLENMNFTDGMYDAENKLFVPLDDANTSNALNALEQANKEEADGT